MLAALFKYSRPLLAAIVVVFALGSVQLYTMFAASVQPREFDHAEHWALGVYSVEITLTFDAVGDDFTLEKGTTLSVEFRGKELLKTTETVPAGRPVVVSPVPDIVEARRDTGTGEYVGGYNEFHVTAIGATAGRGSQDDGFSLQPAFEQPVARAVRVRVLRDGEPVADETIWSDPGKPVEGTVTLRVLPKVEAQQHDH